MAYVYKPLFLTPYQGGRPCKPCTPKGLVIHWTANTNKGADAVANRNYFENHPQNKVSCHYCIDDKQVVHCVPENEMAYHVGATSYKQAALNWLGSYPNSATIGIEMCVNSDGNFWSMYLNTVVFAADILKRHGWSADDLWRHSDVTGKNCPAFFVTDATAKAYGFSAGAAAAWEEFKANVAKEMQGGSKVSERKDIKINIKGTEFPGYLKDGVSYFAEGVPVKDVVIALQLSAAWDGQKVEVK